MDCRRQEVCRACASEIKERPVHLPCKDVVCVKCYNEWTSLETRECPVCHDDIPAYFNLRQDNTDKSVLEYTTIIMNLFKQTLQIILRKFHNMNIFSYINEFSCKVKSMNIAQYIHFANSKNSQFIAQNDSFRRSIQ